MAENRSKLLKLTVRNIGCIGPEPVEIALDEVVCLVGRNNAGKSTILRAYELAQGKETFDPHRDRCRWAPEGEPSAVELDVHIPEGIGNVDSKWKSAQAGHLVVKSRWEWHPGSNYQKVRATWDPALNDWAAEGKAGGADNVFKSRLPQPLRIGSLDDASATEQTLLTLALEPFVAQMEAHESDPDSGLAKTVRALVDHVHGLATGHQKRFDGIAAEVEKGFSGVFPDIGVRLHIGMATPSIKLKDLLRTGSGVVVREGKVETSLAQQGTGTRRALFWSMLQVHNEIKRNSDLKAELKKTISGKLKKEKDEAKIAELKAELERVDTQDKVAVDADDPAFPGYLLLIDEPENALHPMAARMAQRHLYDLGADPNWQVMMTTHSPFFVNPLEDHTTIVRLERVGGDEGPLKHKTYRADSVKFDDIEKRQLQGLQQMDAGFSEVFFGSYPVLVEGDTEHAAFIAAAIAPEHPLANNIAVIRARGKAILPALVRMLHHFKVDFGILHDTDWPYVDSGNKAGMWTINQSIFDEIQAARANGVRVRHRCSFPDFERALGGNAAQKEKPLEAYLRISNDEKLREVVKTLFAALRQGEDMPFAFDADKDGEFKEALLAQLTVWAAQNGHDTDPLLTGKAQGTN